MEKAAKERERVLRLAELREKKSRVLDMFKSGSGGRSSRSVSVGRSQSLLFSEVRDKMKEKMELLDEKNGKVGAALKGRSLSTTEVEGKASTNRWKKLQRSVTTPPGGLNADLAGVDVPPDAGGLGDAPGDDVVSPGLDSSFREGAEHTAPKPPGTFRTMGSIDQIGKGVGNMAGQGAALATTSKDRAAKLTSNTGSMILEKSVSGAALGANVGALGVAATGTVATGALKTGVGAASVAGKAAGDLAELTGMKSSARDDLAAFTVVVLGVFSNGDEVELHQFPLVSSYAKWNTEGIPEEMLLCENSTALGMNGAVSQPKIRKDLLKASTRLSSASTWEPPVGPAGEAHPLGNMGMNPLTFGDDTRRFGGIGVKPEVRSRFSSYSLSGTWITTSISSQMRTSFTEVELPSFLQMSDTTSAGAFLVSTW